MAVCNSTIQGFRTLVIGVPGFDAGEEFVSTDFPLCVVLQVWMTVEKHPMKDT